LPPVLVTSYRLNGPPDSDSRSSWASNEAVTPAPLRKVSTSCTEVVAAFHSNADVAVPLRTTMVPPVSADSV
jgi:hypothetical protein